jgi:CheY-like chemotaxis protein
MACFADRSSDPLVLLVEDNEPTYEIMSEFLALSGFSVSGASDGVEAIESAQRLMPDVIVMDYQLPAINGCEAARAIKEDPRTRHIPILLLTANAERQFVSRAGRAGCDSVLLKPCPLEELRGEITRLLLDLERAAPHAAGRILVVEDDADIRHALMELLNEEGYQVDGAGNGLEALAALRGGPRPDLILLDLMMPIMDGWQFRSAQRKDPSLAAIPVVLLTAMPEAQRRAEQLQALVCVEKPVHVPELIDIIEHTEARHH